MKKLMFAILLLFSIQAMSQKRGYCILLKFQRSQLTKQDQKRVITEVRKDYADYNIQITVSKRKYKRYSMTRKQWVLITDSSNVFPTQIAGRTPHLGSLYNKRDTFAYVFTYPVHYGVMKVASTITHEIGHAIGLDDITYTEQPLLMNGWVNYYGRGRWTYEDKQLLIEKLGLKQKK